MIVSPNEIFAVTAESWMFEESRNEFVVLYLVDGLLLQGPLSGSGPDLPQAGIPALLAHFHPSRLVWSSLYSSLKLKVRILFIVIGGLAVAVVQER